ncbi:G-type lectin S-receptor-like serine/threonine-protein kinase LECRK3 [Rosa rugosa]|uniref:G-type lectin S-receptor-like serine/threonine-protein kinase LECRK3 n=1 Tax=Rosa rugosa TaxID=74645 RepID=UPI002B408D2B|nr:G-type lectin S-receptor-like serine/threonine-protein kinase LECRK3 [Rosa rugosa]
MAFTVCLFLLSSLLLLPTYVLAQTNGSIAVGASLSTAGNSSWLSPSGDFAFGFRQLENNDLFLLSIWFAKIPDKTIVWYANGDKPAPNGSVVNLTANSGLVLTSPQGEQLWKSNQTIAGVVAHGVMDDTGNFALENEKSAKLWETFKNPTDTMLPGQILERGGKLSSRNSETDYTRGHFQLDFQDDGNLVLRGQRPFYSTKTTNGSVPGSEGLQLVFNDSGNFYILRVNGGYYNFTAEELAARDYYLRTTLSFDGVLAQYFLPKTSVGNISWVPLWSEPSNICQKINADSGPSFCGYNTLQENDSFTAHILRRASMRAVIDIYLGRTFTDHMLSKQGSHRVSDDFTVTGRFPVFANHVPALEHNVKIQECTSSGFLSAKLVCASSSLSSNKSERLEKVPLSKVLIWGGRVSYHLTGSSGLLFDRARMNSSAASDFIALLESLKELHLFLLDFGVIYRKVVVKYWIIELVTVTGKLTSSYGLPVFECAVNKWSESHLRRAFLTFTACKHPINQIGLLRNVFYGLHGCTITAFLCTPLKRNVFYGSGIYSLLFCAVKGYLRRTLWAVKGCFWCSDSICTYKADKMPTCECPTGYYLLDPNDPYGSCYPTFKQGCENEPSYAQDLYDVQVLENTDWLTSSYMQFNDTTADTCSQSCLQDCSCAVAVYSNQTCQKKKFPLSYGREDNNLNATTFIKLMTVKKKKSGTTLVHGGSVLLGISVVVIFMSGTAVCLGLFFSFRKKHARFPQNDLDTNLHSFSHKELEEATNGFNEELGRGSFGVVYKGIIQIGSGVQVAVKKLNCWIQDGEKEFKTELNIIGRTHHKNLVHLVGYCDEGQQRSLVYEFLSNGTLAGFLFGDEKPSWRQRMEIAYGVAKGLLYLHEECTTQIIHCDIKPQNILLDDNYNARISDFGLAKLLMTNQSKTHTDIRGTKGYVAPEWFRNMAITTKVDVYSFGVVLLEIICCRRSVDRDNDYEEKAILTDWVYDCYREGLLEAILDHKVDALDYEMKLEETVMIALWCIQEDPSRRPTMRKVVQMLEGVVEVPVPPCPSPYSKAA